MVSYTRYNLVDLEKYDKCNTMRIIVTGGMGFIGSHFVNFVKDQEPTVEVLVVDKLTYAADVNNLNCKVQFLQKDICAVIPEDLGEYDYLINFAAESHVDNSIINGNPFVKTNIQGTFNLLEVARKNKNLKKFIQISTDEVYGDMDDYTDYDSFGHPVMADKTFPLKASSYYSATKASADLLVEAAARTYNLPYMITRTCNNYGDNQHKEKFIPKLIHCIKKEIPVPLYGDGKNIREWIHADDNARMIWTLTKSNLTGVHHISSGERFDNLTVIKLAQHLCGVNLTIEYVEDRKGHDRRYGLTSEHSLNSSNNLGKYLCSVL
jgi:dTDP-glucose 4,6-dehydratase